MSAVLKTREQKSARNKIDDWEHTNKKRTRIGWTGNLAYALGWLALNGLRNQTAPETKMEY